MHNPLRDGDPTRIGPYRLHARLGGGGMGQVFLGRSPGGRLVAVKVVRPELADDAQFRRRFAAEVEAARKVGGFYTAQVVDADTGASPPWLAGAYIPGPSLHQAVDEHGPLPLASVAVLGAGLAEGLAAVHACGVVHRDLKPANVILAEDGPRLIDFGIARALDATSHTQTSAVLGTAAFMSPEQATAQPVGPASDVFSLGCVLAFAATGRSPFGHGPVHAVVYRVVHAEPDLSGVPAPLAGLVAACLAKDPAARPGLGQVLGHLTALSSPDGGGWLPQPLTQVITERRTLALTAVAPSGAFSSDQRHAPPGPAPDQRPAPPGPAPDQRQRPAPGYAQDQRPASGHVTQQQVSRPGPSQHLLVNERRRLRGGAAAHPAAGYQIAVLVMLALFALASVSTVVHQLAVFDDLGIWVPSSSYYADRKNLQAASLILLTIQIVAGAGLVTCWLLWFFRVRVVAEGLAPGRLRYRPAMAVLGWFVPIANLWLPKQIADDVWHASSPSGRGGAMAPPALLHTWWAMWLLTFLTWPLFWTDWTEIGDVRRRDDDVEMLQSFVYTPAVWGSLAVHLLVVPTVIVTARYVRRLSAMQAAALS